VQARSELAVPLRLGERFLGLLVIQRENAALFDDEDLFTVTTIAGQVAVALENARLLDAERQLRTLSVTEERNRMAREIHDTLAQGFVGITLQLRAMKSATDPELQRFYLVQAESLAKESLEEARRSVWNLRPQPLQHQGLAGALASELERLERSATLSTSLHTHGNLLQLPAPVEGALLRIAQEALHNALKYAHASHVSLHLTAVDQSVTLIIADDGVGFTPSALAPKLESGGFGLGNMTERARLLGGRLTIDAAPDRGCRITVQVPIGRS
jgi:signal transduction histidine kinase